LASLGLFLLFTLERAGTLKSYFTCPLDVKCRLEVAEPFLVTHRA